MNNTILRAAIVGCGGIANNKHLPVLVKQENLKIVAFCDIIEQRAIDARAKFGKGDEYITTDYHKVIEDKDVDVVYVLTPNRSHSFITVDALNAGKHVMCEKPMAINSAEAKKMLDAAKATGKKLSIGYQNRHRPDSL